MATSQSELSRTIAASHWWIQFICWDRNILGITFSLYALQHTILTRRDRKLCCWTIRKLFIATCSLDSRLSHATEEQLLEVLKYSLSNTNHDQDEWKFKAYASWLMFLNYVKIRILRQSCTDLQCSLNICACMQTAALSSYRIPSNIILP